MDILLDRRVRLNCKAALGIISLLSESEDYEDYTSFWNGRDSFTIDDLTSVELAQLLWDRLYDEGDNQSIINAMKATSLPNELIDKLGERFYYKLAKGDSAVSLGREKLISRWASNAGLSVGKSNLLTLQYDTAKEYFTHGFDVFVQDVQNFVQGEPSLLNLKEFYAPNKNTTRETFIKIGAEDDPVRSGGPILGYIKIANYGIHPIMFLLAMESLALLRFTQFAEFTDEGEQVSEVKFFLEGNIRASRITSFNNGLPSGSGLTPDGGYITVFPLWEKRVEASDLRGAFLSNELRINRAQYGDVLNIFSKVRNHELFGTSSIFYCTAIDSSTRLAYYLGSDFKYGQNEISYYDRNESGPVISSRTGFANLDAYLKSNWAIIKREDFQQLNGLYMNYKFEKAAGKAALLPQLVDIIASNMDDGSVEFAVALNLRRSYVKNDLGSIVPFHSTLMNGENILEKVISSDSGYSMNALNRDGIKALQYGIDAIDIARIENFFTQLWIMSDDAVKKYIEEKRDDLKVRKLCLNGEDISLRGLPLLHDWAIGS